MMPACIACCCSHSIMAPILLLSEPAHQLVVTNAYVDANCECLWLGQHGILLRIRLQGCPVDAQQEIDAAGKHVVRMQALQK